MATPLKSWACRSGIRSEWTELAPRRALAEVVAATWSGSAGWARRLRLLPDGCADLVWDGQRLSAIPPSDRPLYGMLEAHSRNVGLRLQCGLVGPILGSQPRWSSWRAEGERRLRRTREPEHALEVLQDLIEQRLNEADVDAACLAAVRRIKAGGSLAEASEAAGLEPRELRRRFAWAVGLSPKRLQRVARFERLRLQIGRTPAASLAVDLGYADQAHMIRECRALSGSTPRELAAG
jgi:AraC-like DNA-binding protein